MFEILKVTVIFGGGSREVNNIDTIRDVVKLRVKDELCDLVFGTAKRVVLAYREKE